MARFNLTNIPVVVKTPAWGYSWQQLFIKITAIDPLAAPNAVALVMLGDYTPGTIQSFGILPDGSYMMSIKDFTIASGVPPAAITYVGPSGTQHSEDLSLEAQYIPKRKWDAICIIWNLVSMAIIPIDLSQTIESVRCALIVRNAFEIL